METLLFSGCVLAHPHSILTEPRLKCQGIGCEGMGFSSLQPIYMEGGWEWVNGTALL